MAQDTRPTEFHRPTPRASYSPRRFCVCRDATGSPWAAWHATENGQERIRVFSPSQAPETETVSDLGLHFEPDLAGGPDGGVWCVWSRRRDGRWHAVARHRGEQWGPEIVMPSDSDEFVFHVAAECDELGRLWVAYAAWSRGRAPRVGVRRLDAGTWSDEVSFDAECPQMRPVLAAGGDGAMWIAFCAYTGGDFRVVTARMAPDAVGTLQVEHPMGSCKGRQQLFPDLCLAGDGALWIAWVTYTDVVRDGVVGRQASLDVARYDDGRWHQSSGRFGSTVAYLDWGMLPVETYWGYNGLRHRPQLSAGAYGIWVFWERHRTEVAVPENVANGQFCGCRFDGSGWSVPQLIHNADSCFTISGLGRLDGEMIEWACRRAPDAGEEGCDIAFMTTSSERLTTLADYPPDAWDDWRVTQLPEAVTGPPPPSAITAESGDYELLWGDLHCHSYYSPDAEGEPLELLMYARDRGGLDFCCIIDNDYYPHVVLSAGALDYLYAVAQSFDEETMAAFWGYEYTYHEPHEGGRPKNHRAVVCYDRDQPLARRTDPEGAEAAAFVRTMRDTATLWHAHHEEWALWGAEEERNVEVAAGWGDYMQWTDVTQRHLRGGYRFGLTGASDNHRICPGMGGAVTGLYVRGRTRADVVEALKARRCFATTGCRLLLDLRVNGHLQGEVVSVAGAPRLRLSVRSATSVEQVRVLRDGETIVRFDVDTGEFDWHHTDEAAEAGEHIYRAEVRLRREIAQFPHNIAQAVGAMAYSSPIWVRLEEAQSPGRPGAPASDGGAGAPSGPK